MMYNFKKAFYDRNTENFVAVVLAQFLNYMAGQFYDNMFGEYSSGHSNCIGGTDSDSLYLDLNRL